MRQGGPDLTPGPTPTPPPSLLQVQFRRGPQKINYEVKNEVIFSFLTEIPGNGTGRHPDGRTLTERRNWSRRLSGRILIFPDGLF